MSTQMGQKIAIMVGNGFNQNDMIAAQKAFLKAGAHPRLISPETGLVNGWDNADWGHNFAVEEPLSTALGADYDVLVVPGGERSINKLKLTAHTRRFVGSFVNAGKPIILFDDASLLMAVTDLASGQTLYAPEAIADQVVAAGGRVSDTEIVTVNNVMSGQVTNNEQRARFVSEMLLFVFPACAVNDEADNLQAA